jgi:hypothetical protein
MLPVGTRLSYRKGLRGILVVEYKPTCRTIFVGNYSRYLSFPYVVFIMPYLDFRVFKYTKRLSIGFRSKPIESIFEKIGLATLPNVYFQYKVCMDINSNWFASGFTIKTLFNKAISRFWNSKFEETAGKWWPDGIARSLDLWQEKTLQCDQFASNFKWEDIGEASTLHTIINSCTYINLPERTKLMEINI